MKNLISRVRNHGKKITIHLKRHHRKYLFGIVCCFILALIVVHTASTINNIFAGEEVIPSITYDSSANITYTDTEGHIFTGIGTITISNGVNSITMLDRNLGATTNDINSTGSYGYHFQRGNNYGFDPFDESVEINATGVTVNSAGYGPGNFFSGNIFRIGNPLYDWSNPKNDNLRGGSGDNDENNRGYPAIHSTDRQGPCPDGYHVPSRGERGTLFSYWVANYTGNGSELTGLWYSDNFPEFGSGNYVAADQFQKDFKIPLAGFRRENDSQRENQYQDGEEVTGFYSSLWSSTPLSGRSYMFFLNSAFVQEYNVDNRSRANSIRCFKDALDLISPTCTVKYSTMGMTSKDVVAYLSGCSEDITGTDLQYTFTGNGSHTFEFQDLAGNTGSVKAEVSWITSITYDSGANITYTDTEGNIFTGIGTITIVNGSNSITILDRNLGAITNDINSTGSHGYHYQWGNNYGFKSCYESGCSTFPNGERTGTTRVTSAGRYGPTTSWYSSSIFILAVSSPYDWAEPSNGNLWGGNGDNIGNDWGYPISDSADRQGPCPIGFHVPSYGELLKISDMVDISDIHSKLLIPFAGTRSMLDGKLGSLSYGSLWSSTPDVSETHGSRALSTHSGGSLALSSNSRAYAFSIRCFKNPDGTVTGHMSAYDGVSFSVSVNDNVKAGEYTDFIVKVLKDGETFKDYDSTIYFELTDKSGKYVDPTLYTISGNGMYDFNKSDQGKKVFRNGLKVNKAGTYKLEVYDLFSDKIMGSEMITVGGNYNSFEYDKSKFDPNYSNEMNEAYQFARYYNITTKANIKGADMRGGLNRIAMAKMLSNYAINVLGKNNLDESKDCSFRDISPSLDRDYDYGVTKACQLGIMGINMPDNKFFPNGRVTRAEFATALSRLLYGTKDGVDKYYSPHIYKLYNEGIINNTDPKLWEKKGYIMLMLMRARKKYSN